MKMKSFHRHFIVLLAVIVFITISGNRAWGKLHSNRFDSSGFNWSYGNGAGGGQQVGQGRSAATGNIDRALLWNGTAEVSSI